MLRQTSNNLRIGQLAKRTGVSLQSVRYYEREGLLPKPQRLASGYRTFAPETVWQIQFIKHAQNLGFSLADIRELLSIQSHSEKECADVRRLAEEKLAEIERLEAIRRALRDLAKQCPGRGSSHRCPIIKAISSE
jgi:MerR family transcriptional regulator, copper efflux regulator